MRRMRVLRVMLVWTELLYIVSGTARAEPSVTKDPPILYDKEHLIIHRGDCSFDANGMIIDEDKCHPDGGDTAQREGWYWFGVLLRQKTPGLRPWPYHRFLTFEQVLDKLEPHHDGVFYRHPTLPGYDNPYDTHDGTTRDQLVPLIAAMGLEGHQQARIKRLWNALPVDHDGKHAFEGTWKPLPFVRGAAQDCGKIERQTCAASFDCSVSVPLNECVLGQDIKDCGAGEDKRSCALKSADRNCDVTVQPPPYPSFLPKPPGYGPHTIHDGNAACVATRTAEAILYKQQKDQCEIDKALANKIWEPQRAACMAIKVADETKLGAEFLACKAASDSISSQVAHVNALCQIARLGNPCEAYKAARTELCLSTNYYYADVMGPQYINLFLRALNRNPLLPAPDFMVPISPIVGGEPGDLELLASIIGRIQVSLTDKDDTGPDLNVIIGLLLSEIRHPSPTSITAVHRYSTERQYSYGSYLQRYYATYGMDLTTKSEVIAKRIQDGIDHHNWKPEVSPALGAAMWYHMASNGANPALATLYAPIIEFYLK